MRTVGIGRHAGRLVAIHFHQRAVKFVRNSSRRPWSACGQSRYIRGRPLRTFSYLLPHRRHNSDSHSTITMRSGATMNGCQIGDCHRRMHADRTIRLGVAPVGRFIGNRATDFRMVAILTIGWHRLQLIGLLVVRNPGQSRSGIIAGDQTALVGSETTHMSLGDIDGGYRSHRWWGRDDPAMGIPAACH